MGMAGDTIMFKKLDELEHLQGANFSNKSENFLICQLSRKSQHFIYQGLEIVQNFSPNGEGGKFPTSEESKIFLGIFAFYFSIFFGKFRNYIHPGL